MKVTGWDNGLCQDYDKGLGRWFANRLGARQQLRQDFKMTQFVNIDRAMLEQALEALLNTTGLPSTDARSFDNRIMSIRALRAALANAEPTGWQTLVDQGKEAHELAKIMRDFADKNPASLMLKGLK